MLVNEECKIRPSYILGCLRVHANDSADVGFVLAALQGSCHIAFSRFIIHNIFTD